MRFIIVAVIVVSFLQGIIYGRRLSGGGLDVNGDREEELKVIESLNRINDDERKSMSKTTKTFIELMNKLDTVNTRNFK